MGQGIYKYMVFVRVLLPSRTYIYVNRNDVVTVKTTQK